MQRRASQARRRVDIEAKPPKLGPFIEAINVALSDPRPLSKS